MLTIFTKPSCVQCTATKREVERLGITYTEQEITAELAQQFKDRGLMSAPVVITKDGEEWAGYRRERLRELVG